ncbi:MAG TPA: MFS transporter, partial [Candidatus Acidoferrales bacterium]|nr:MFS transporter [Candidatus Acidoferrales bacterium]
MEPVAEIRGREPSLAGNANAPLMNERAPAAIHLRIVALAFAAWIFDFYDLILYSFLLVPVARELHLTPAESALALGMSLLMTALGGIIFGFLGDRFGRRPMIVATVAIYGVGTLLCGFSRTLTQLIVFRSITGLGMGGGWAPGQSLVAESVPAERRARYAAYVQTGAPLGVLLAAAAGGYLAPAIGWRHTFMISAIPAVFVAAAVIRWMPESDVWQRARANRAGSFDWSAIRDHRRIFAWLFVIVLLNSEAYWFTYTWMPGYLELKRGLGAAAASHLMMTMQVGGVAGYLSFGRVADRIGRRPAFCAYGLLMAAGTIPPTIGWTWAIATPG